MSLRRAASRFVKNLKTNTIGDFFSCVEWPLMCYRCFGLFPVCWERGNESSFSFEWTTPYMIFINMPILIMQAVILAFYFWQFMLDGFVFPITSIVFNYACGFLASVFMLKLAKDLRIMVRQIMTIERKLPAIKKNGFIVRHTFILVIVGCIGSLIQCGLNVFYLRYLSASCSPSYNEQPLQSYFENVFQMVFQHFEFNYIVAVICQAVKLHDFCIPTLNNMVIVACSVYIENRYNNLNEDIKEKLYKYNGAVFTDWRKIQDHYVQLSKLVRVIDKRINPIVLISFFIDLYNSCLSFFYVIAKKNFHPYTDQANCFVEFSDNWEPKLYKYYLAFFVLMKTVMVSLVCARLYTSSRELLNGLHTIPQGAYNYDTHRFMEQVYHSNIALSGFEFFYINKEMILTVLRILVTYELVLLQFK